MAQPVQPPTQINIELPADLERVYNFAIINHSPSEIVIDFRPAALPTSPQPRCMPAS